jgi:DNA-binding MarR family transcriptional regulator
MYTIRMPQHYYDEVTTGRLLWLVTTKWRTAVDRAVASLGLTHAQYALLASLYGHSLAGDRPSQRELAETAALEPIYVSKLTRALERAGLVARSANPADPRARQLSLTESGTSVVRQAMAVVQALQDELTAPIGGVGSAQNRELVRILRALLGRTSPNITTEKESGERSMSQEPILTGQDIGEAAGAVRGLLDTVLHEAGITSDEFIAMRVIAARGPWAPGVLREFLAGQPQLGLSHPAAGALLYGLATRGLITGASSEWQPARPERSAQPGEEASVRLTARGSKLFDELNEEVRATSGRLYADLDAADQATAKKVLITVAERANRLRAGK